MWFIELKEIYNKSDIQNDLNKDLLYDEHVSLQKLHEHVTTKC